MLNKDFSKCTYCGLCGKVAPDEDKMIEACPNGALSKETESCTDEECYDNWTVSVETIE
jgi:ferredoxin